MSSAALGRHILRLPTRRLLCASSSSPSTPTHGGHSSAGPGVVELNPPRGTRDFPPEDMRLRTWLFDHFREVSRLMAFEEVDFPVLESEALFIRKAGEEITQQLYNFEDKAGRRVVLRPEITPSLARLVIRQGTSAPLPLRWFTIGQCWRYERMTRGRRREHYQWNMDIFGVPGVRAEAELLQAIVLLFERLGIASSDVGIRLSSRKVLQVVLDMYSVPHRLFTALRTTRGLFSRLLIDKGNSGQSAVGGGMISYFQHLEVKMYQPVDSGLGTLLSLNC